MNKKKNKKGLYLIGGLFMGLGVAIAMPKFINYYSEKTYKPTPIEDDDFDSGPEIIKRVNS